MKFRAALVSAIFLLTCTVTALSSDLDKLPLDDSSRSRKLSEQAVQRGHAHFQAGEFDLAALSYEEALTLNPENSRIWEKMADAQLSIGLIHDAMLSLEEAERTALDYERKKHLLQRIEQLIEEVRSAEENYQAGLDFLETGEWNKAILNFKRAVCLNPTEARYYRRTGRLLADLGFYSGAVDSFKRLLQLREGVLAEDALFLSDLLLRMGKRPAAWRVLQWGHATFPDNQELFLRVKEMGAWQENEQKYGPIQGKTRARIIKRTGMTVTLEAGYQDGLSQKAAFKKRLVVYRDSPSGSNTPPTTVGEVLITLVEPRTSTAVVRESQGGTGIREGDWVVLE